MSETGGDRVGYVLVIGPAGKDRDRVHSVLGQGVEQVFSATADEVLAIADLVPPALVVFQDDAAGTREHRQAGQQSLLHHPPLIGVPLLVLAWARDIDSFTGAITKGAAGYLANPFDEGELVATARRLSHWRDTGGFTEKRRRVRRPLIMRIEVTVRGRHVTVPGQLLDVSSRGCRVEVDIAVASGEKVRIVLHGPDGSTHVALGADVCWHALVGEGRHQLGLLFSGSTALMAPVLLGAPGAKTSLASGSSGARS